MENKRISVLSAGDEENLEHGDLTADDLLNEIAKQFLDELCVPKGSITVSEMVEKTGKTDDAIRPYLNKLVKQGKMKKVKVRNTIYYYKE